MGKFLTCLSVINFPTRTVFHVVVCWLLPIRVHYFLLALPLPRSNPTRYKYHAQSCHWHTSFTCQWRWNRQWVPKRQQLELRRRGITQKGTNYFHVIHVALGGNLKSWVWSICMLYNFSGKGWDLFGLKQWFLELLFISTILWPSS